MIRAKLDLFRSIRPHPPFNAVNPHPTCNYTCAHPHLYPHPYVYNFIVDADTETFDVSTIHKNSNGYAFTEFKDFKRFQNKIFSK